MDEAPFQTTLWRSRSSVVSCQGTNVFHGHHLSKPPPPRTVCLIHKCLQVNLVCSSALHRLFKLLHWSGLRCCKTDFDTTRTGCSALLTSSECSIVNLSPLTMMNMSMRTSNFWCYLVQLLGVLCNCADLYGNVQARSGMYVLHMVQ